MTQPQSPPEVQRPTSPHVSIYRWQISNTLSILHRITGFSLVVGTALLVLWLWSAAYSPAYFVKLHACLASPIGQLLLLGWTGAFYYHLGNGIRHLFWDIGKGFTIPQMNRSGVLVLIFAIFMTAATWFFVLGAAAQVQE